jgi:hypothetical protein
MRRIGGRIGGRLRCGQGAASDLAEGVSAEASWGDFFTARALRLRGGLGALDLAAEIGLGRRRLPQLPVGRAFVARQAATRLIADGTVYRD